MRAGSAGLIGLTRSSARSVVCWRCLSRRFAGSSDGHESPDHQLLLPAGGRRRRSALAEAGRLPARAGNRNARPGPRRFALAAERPRAGDSGRCARPPRSLRRPKWDPAGRAVTWAKRIATALAPPAAHAEAPARSRRERQLGRERSSGGATNREARRHRRRSHDLAPDFDAPDWRAPAPPR